MPEKKLRVALIGTGGEGGDFLAARGFNSPGNWGLQHARIYHQRTDLDFVGIVGRDAVRTKSRAEEYGTRPYTDIDEMLKRESPDLVSVVLPNLDHFAVTLKLIQAGVPLLVEKPLVFTLSEADILMNEASKRGLFFAICFNHRYAKPLQLAKEAVDAGRLGDLTFASWRFGGEGASTHPHANLLETQCHGFDMLEHLCGPIRSVMAEMTDKTGGGFRTLSLALRFESGAVGSLIGTYDSSYAYQDAHSLELDGTAGRVVVHDTVKAFEYQARGNEVAEHWSAGYFNDLDREFHRITDRYFDEMLAALRQGHSPPVPATAGYRAVRLAYAAIEAFNSGKRVSIPAT